MFNIPSNHRSRKQNRRAKKLAVEAVEQRNLMAADVVPGLESLASDPLPAHVANEVPSVDLHHVGNNAASSRTISNGFPGLRFGLPDLRGVASIDVWEHAYAHEQGRLAGLDASEERPVAEIGSSGLDGVDLVDSVFAELGEAQEADTARMSSLAG